MPSAPVAAAASLSSSVSAVLRPGRLLQHRVHTTAETGQRRCGVQVRGHRDDDRIQRLRIEHLVDCGVGRLRGVPGDGRAARLVDWIADRRQRHVVEGIYGGEVVQASGTDTNNRGSEIRHVKPPGPVYLLGSLRGSTVVPRSPLETLSS